jgi:hypothetical protein
LDQIESNFEEKLKSHSEKVLKKPGLTNIFKENMVINKQGHKKPRS